MLLFDIVMIVGDVIYGKECEFSTHNGVYGKLWNKPACRL